jgi:hypothetical protein
MKREQEVVRIRRTITMVSLVVFLFGVVSGMAGQNEPALKDVFKNNFLMSEALNRNTDTL